MDNNITKHRDFAEIASDLLSFTGRHLFLTGKAGTGKTTFLKNFLEKTPKKTVVVAPTGVAAINAGGMTIHSLFQFAPGMFIPAMSGAYGQDNVFNRSNLAKSIYLSKAKREVIVSMELLIIDEVSMLRADLLDAMDTMLRSVRRRYREPMGGVQVLYIGDLWQLPPVVKDEEWHTLGQYYESPFFFSAKVIEETNPLIVEFNKIYRQSDENFIEILNNIRNNTLHKDDFYELNKLYQPEFENFEDENLIVLTTHNYKAQKINQQKLAQLDAEAHVFNADLKGDYPEHNLPTENELVLKVGAQVMFLKNDPQEKKRYFNGKIGTIANIRQNKDGEPEITVRFSDGNEIIIEKEVWNNIRFEYNLEEDTIDENILGSFTQFPIKPAWAITIHKSQGLTFENIVIDAGQAFAPGQVYVALSRCTTLKGITLLSEITPEAVSTDPRIQKFAAARKNAAQLEEILKNERKAFEVQQILEKYSLHTLNHTIHHIDEIYEGKKPPPNLKLEEFAYQLKMVNNELIAVANKFQPQLRTMLVELDIALLKERVEKATHYFSEKILNEILLPILRMQAVLSKTKRVKSIEKKLEPISIMVKQQINKLQQLYFLGDLIFENSNFNLHKWCHEHQIELKSKSAQLAKEANKSSNEVTLDMIKEGKSIETIAEERNLAASTIWGHAAKMIADKLIKAEAVLSKEIIEDINNTIQTFEEKPNVGQIKNVLGDKYLYGQYQCVLNSLE